MKFVEGGIKHHKHKKTQYVHDLVLLSSDMMFHKQVGNNTVSLLNKKKLSAYERWIIRCAIALIF
jgi:hypothetical protein